MGWQVLDGIHNHFGQAYARNTTLLNREKIFAPVSRELALSLRLAESQVTRQWLEDESDEAKRDLFFREAEGYRKAFHDHAYFVGSKASQGYYFNDSDTPFSPQPRYLMKSGTSTDEWYYGTLRADAPYNLNVDRNIQSQTIRIWFNIVVRDGARALGVVGSGINLSSFLDEFVASNEQGVTSIIVDEQGAVQVHPDKNRVAMNSGALNTASLATSLFGLLGSETEVAEVRQALAEAMQTPGSVAVRWVTLEDKRQLLALTHIPELKWYVVTAIDLNTARVIEGDWLTPALIVLGALLLVLILGFAFVVERLVLRPLRQLQQGAQAMAAGRYDVVLPTGNRDEIGELSAAFGVMAQKVRSHTSELENRVRERTQALEQANSEMAAAHKKIDDSIDYASLIQHAILPKRQLVSALGQRHAVLWRPRDVVGGDFYVYRAGDNGCLFGVVDCAGHGVPGALMTMLAHAAIDQAISDAGLSDPASILTRTDRIVRNMLRDEAESQVLATTMDIGLAYVDFTRRDVTFAGAKIALYYSDGETVVELPAGRRAIGDKRVGEYTNAQAALQTGRTFYLSTDGFLDQAGGELGYGFGSSRFAEMIVRHSRLPLIEQSAAFSATLADYQGTYAQRDDITMLCFRFD